MRERYPPAPSSATNVVVLRTFFPNFGAEERDADPSKSPPLLLQNLDTAWRRLFDAGAVFADVDDNAFVAWLNTPLAARRAAAAGRALWGADPDVVDVVHDKAFCVDVVRRHGLIDPRVDALITVIDAGDVDEAALVDAVAYPPGMSAMSDPPSFTIKPRRGSSGRGRVDGRHPERFAGAVERLRACHGVVVEPWLSRVLDLSAQWRIHDDARIELLGTTRAITSAAGGWHAAVLVVDDAGVVRAATDAGKPVVWERQLVEDSYFVVEAAARAGHRGACGVDAFVYVSPFFDGPQLRLVELNARFTAGLVAVGLARGCAAGSWLRFEPSSSASLSSAAPGA